MRACIYFKKTRRGLRSGSRRFVPWPRQDQAHQKLLYRIFGRSDGAEMPVTRRLEGKFFSYYYPSRSLASFMKKNEIPAAKATNRRAPAPPEVMSVSIILRFQ